MWGRWFTGAHDETGVDVKLVKASGDPAVFGTSVSALKTASTAQAVKIFGANLPAGAQAGGHRHRPGREGGAHRLVAA